MIVVIAKLFSCSITSTYDSRVASAYRCWIRNGRQVHASIQKHKQRQAIKSDDSANVRYYHIVMQKWWRVARLDGSNGEREGSRRKKREWTLRLIKKTEEEVGEGGRGDGRDDKSVVCHRLWWRSLEMYLRDDFCCLYCLISLSSANAEVSTESLDLLSSFFRHYFWHCRNPINTTTSDRLCLASLFFIASVWFLRRYYRWLSLSSEGKRKL